RPQGRPLWGVPAGLPQGVRAAAVRGAWRRGEIAFIMVPTPTPRGDAMHELTADNVAAYLRQMGWIGDEPAAVEALSGGVCNLVRRVETPAQLFILKQSRPQLRTRDAWFSDLARIFREQETMEALAPLLPGVVPAVLHSDRDNYVFTMSHAPRDAAVWKAQLL